MKWLPDGWQDVGALAGMVALAWNGIAVFYNRHRFKFECDVKQMYEMTGSGYRPTSWVTYLEVVNVGKQPGFLAGVQGRVSKERKFLINLEGLPKELKPGERWNCPVPNLSALDPDTIDLWAEDTEGRHFRISKKRLKALKIEAAEVQKTLTTT